MEDTHVGDERRRERAHDAGDALDARQGFPVGRTTGVSSTYRAGARERRLYRVAPAGSAPERVGLPPVSGSIRTEHASRRRRLRGIDADRRDELFINWRSRADAAHEPERVAAPRARGRPGRGVTKSFDGMEIEVFLTKPLAVDRARSIR
jgi:hypothetical protein